MVRITNIETGRTYITDNVHACRDSTDRSGFETCLEMGGAISMGKMVFEIADFGDEINETEQYN